MGQDGASGLALTFRVSSFEPKIMRIERASYL